jgi:hypothetical protein
MAEILDLVAKVSWDTNSEELKALNQQVKVQDKALEELRLKGRRLEEQLVKTNDPKKVKLYNEQLQAVKRSADAITEAQKKQATATESLKQKQKQLHDELRKNNDPKMVQGLLRGLHTVENQMDALTSKATTFGSKFSGVTNLLGGLGIGLGAGALVGGAISLLQGSIDEIIEAEKSARGLRLALESAGKTKYFDGLIEEANTLAKAFGNIYDNDEIVQAQTELVKYGKVTREELSQLTKIAIELASKTGTDLVTASNKLVDILAGRGASTLRDFGLSIKDAKTESERMNLVLGEFAKKVEGASEAYANSAEGIRKQNELIIANAKENIGEKLLPIYAGFLTGLNELLEGKFKNVFERFQGRGALVDAMNAYRNNVNKLVDETLQDIDKTEKALYGAQRLGANASVINALKRKLEDLRALKQDTEKLSKGVDGDEETEKKKVQTTKKTAEQKKKVEEEYYNDVTNLDKEYQKMLDDASKQSIERVQNANEKKYENNKKYKQMELDLIKENLDAELPDDVAEQKEKSRLAREELYNQVLNTANTAQEVINIEQQKTDRLIALQEERVNSARENSAVSLKIEQERLDALLEKRRKYERAQRIIDAGVIVANQAVAISGAIRQVATSKNFVEIAANVLAIGAGITASVLAVRNAFADDGFKEGGYTGDGDPNQESTAIGKRPYKYHKKEFVMDEELTSKHRDLFEGIHKRDLVIQKMDDGKYYIAPDTDRLVSDYYSSKSDSTLQPLLSEVAQMRKILAQREVNITNTFDADGFGQSVATQLGIAELKRMRR